MSYSVFKMPRWDKPEVVVEGLTKHQASQVAGALERETGKGYTWGSDIQYTDSGLVGYTIVMFGEMEVLKSWRV